MRLIVFLLVVWLSCFVGFVEIGVRFSEAPMVYDRCINGFAYLDVASKEQYCSCKTDVLISKRYEHMWDKYVWGSLPSFLGGKEKSFKVSDLPGFHQCVAIEQRAVKEKIGSHLESDMREQVVKWLPRQTRQNLRGIILRRYEINADGGDGVRPYVADVYFTVSDGGFGLIKNTEYQGKFYYYMNGEFADAEWRSTGSHINADGLFEGVKRVMDLFGEN